MSKQTIDYERLEILKDCGLPASEIRADLGLTPKQLNDARFHIEKVDRVAEGGASYMDAHRKANELEDYWALRGVRIKTWIERNGCEYVVRSDLGKHLAGGSR